MKAEIPVFSLQQGQSPLLVSIPHAGTHLPSWLLPRLTPQAQQLGDTDWHLPRVYDFLAEMDITLLVATYSRYVVDLNRPPDDASLYPGQSTTGLCPVDDFAGKPLYLAGAAPEPPEIRARIDAYWRPYHAALESELARLKALHGHAVLWDAHSIHSHVPRFFDGELPHLNFGTADHQACDAALVEQLVEAVHSNSDYSWIVNGRFKGGYITRHYGSPANGIHALQLEMAMRTYMPETASIPEFDDTFARPARALLRTLLESALRWQPPAP